MSRKISLLALLFVISSLIFAQNKPFALKGVFLNTNFDESLVYIQKLDENKTRVINVDSILVKDQGFNYNSFIDNDGSGMMLVSAVDVNNERRTTLFFPEEGEIEVSIGDQIRVGGTPKNDEIQKFIDQQVPLNLELKQVVQKYSDLPSTDENKLAKKDELESLYMKLNELSYDFTEKNIKNDIGEYMILSISGLFSPDQLRYLLNGTRPSFKESELGQRLSFELDALLMREGEGKYKDIRLKDQNGKDVALSDYIGKGDKKLILLDFWASWCGPCIKNMPELVDFYKKYKDKGFEIIGISLDEKEQNWKYVIERLDMTWPQMSDLKGWQSAASQLYNVTAIPYTLLLDGDGNALGVFYTNEELFEKVKELLD